jgi:hypothetical protein
MKTPGRRSKKQLKKSGSGNSASSRRSSGGTRRRELRSLAIRTRRRDNPLQEVSRRPKETRCGRIAGGEAEGVEAAAVAVGAIAIMITGGRTDNDKPALKPAAQGNYTTPAIHRNQGSTSRSMEMPLQT